MISPSVVSAFHLLADSVRVRFPPQRLFVGQVILYPPRFPEHFPGGMAVHKITPSSKIKN